MESPQVSLKKHKGLHDSDSRFVEEVIKVVSSLDGSSSMKLKLFTKFPTRFTIILCDPPSMSLDDMNQILLMNDKIIHIKVNLQESQLRIEAYKHSETGKKKRKRPVEDMEIPSGYNVSMVNKKDRKHMEGILRSLLGMTTMEFTSEIHATAGYYNLELRDIETMDIEYIVEVSQKYRAFITHIVFDYPQKKMLLKIRRNDTPITSINTGRKRLKLRN